MFFMPKERNSSLKILMKKSFIYARLGVLDSRPHLRGDRLLAGMTARNAVAIKFSQKR